MKIGTRLIIYLVVTLVVVMSAHALINVIQSRREFRDEVHRSAEKMARIVADGVQVHLETGEEEHLKRLLSIMGRLEGVLELVVHSPEGKVLGRFRIPSEHAPVHPEIETPSFIPESGMGRGVRWGDRKAYEYIYPVSFSPGKDPAFVHVFMDLSFIEHHNIRARWTNVATIASMTALLAVLFSLFIRRSVVLPLEDLTRAVTGYREGKWSDDIRASKDDEIGTLAGEFNAMVHQIDKANRRLIEEREHQLAIFHSLREGVIVQDSSRQVISWNPSALLLSGIYRNEDPAEVLMKFLEGAGKNLFESLDAIFRNNRDEVLLPAFECKCLDGKTRKIRANVRRLKGGPMAGGAVLVLEDVTEQEALSQQVMRAERLASIGQLASGLAHEIGTPLNVVSGRVQQALARLEDHHPAREKLSPIVGQIDRISALVRRLLEFARGGPIQARDVDLNYEIREVLTLMETTQDKSDVEADVRLSDTLPAILADAGQMQQLVLNLYVNALQAIPDGGRIRISTREEDGGVLLEVSDTGPGIPEFHLNRIFDPFFTTKDVKEGTGLGLTVCHRIVEDHAGRIEAFSAPGEGATFRVWLPFRPKEVFHDQPVS